MNEPITAIISAIGFAVISILIIGYLIKEMYRYYSKQNKNNQ